MIPCPQLSLVRERGQGRNQIGSLLAEGGIKPAAGGSGLLGGAHGAFPTAGQMASWTGLCPGWQESAGQGQPPPAPRAQPGRPRAVRTGGCFCQHRFRRLVVRVGHANAVWAAARRLCRILWKILHEGAHDHDIERGLRPDPRTGQRRIQRPLRKLGCPLPPDPLPQHHRP